MGNPMDLTRDDVAMLFDALESHKTAKANGGLMGDLMGTIIEGKLPPEEQKKREDERVARQEKRARESRELSERVVVVQAKLVMLRDRMEIDSTIRVGA